MDTRLGERRVDRIRDLLDRLDTVDRAQDARVAIVVDHVRQGGQLLEHPDADRLGPVVHPLVQLRPVEVAHAGDERRARHLVVRMPGGAADPAAGHAPHQLVRGHLDEDRSCDPLPVLVERVVQRCRLYRGAWKAVEHHARCRVGAGEPVEEQADRDLVGDELARVHVPARFHAQARPIPDGGTEQVPGGDRRDAEPIREEGRLGALPGPWGAEKNNHVHRMNPSYWRIRSWASSCFIVSTTTLTTIRMPVPPSARPWNCGWIRAMNGGSAATMPRNSAPATVIRVTTRAR